MSETSQRIALDRFLASVEKRAFRMAQMHTKDTDCALDVVQNAMIKLAQNYAHLDATQWQPLFYKILSNCINDWHRQQQRWWQRFQSVFSDDENEGYDQYSSQRAEDPLAKIQQASAIEKLEKVLSSLSPGQRQAFMLRCWEGLSTRDTAMAMGCSEGTVKTQYSRAMNHLKSQLGEEWP